MLFLCLVLFDLFIRQTIFVGSEVVNSNKANSLLVTYTCKGLENADEVLWSESKNVVNKECAENCNGLHKFSNFRRNRAVCAIAWCESAASRKAVRSRKGKPLNFSKLTKYGFILIVINIMSLSQ